MPDEEYRVKQVCWKLRTLVNISDMTAGVELSIDQLHVIFNTRQAMQNGMALIEAALCAEHELILAKFLIERHDFSPEGVLSTIQDFGYFRNQAIGSRPYLDLDILGNNLGELQEATNRFDRFVNELCVCGHERLVHVANKQCCRECEIPGHGKACKEFKPSGQW